MIWYDNNCHLQRHLNAQQDTYFENCALPVDVFHYKSKHSNNDVFCRDNCNPKLFPELTTADGEWLVNSSAAEQANVWIGRFVPIVREMLPHRFNFFMDEMIQRRNEMIRKRLIDKGARPWLIPM